jgi:hypothetical protein
MTHKIAALADRWERTHKIAALADRWERMKNIAALADRWGRMKNIAVGFSRRTEKALPPRALAQWFLFESWAKARCVVRPFRSVG